MATEVSNEAVFREAARLHDELVAALIRLIEIPGLSTRPTPELRAAATLVGELAAESGFSVELWETGGAPVVFAEIAAPRGAPTVLFYGHYDVQPAEPLDAWESPPFTAVQRDGAIYGRGAGDNKGQFIAHIMAARALRAAGGSPVGIKLLIEGEEEIGSPHLADVVASRSERLGCDLVITADGPRARDGRPSVIFGVRGLVYIEARVAGAPRDLHSGSRGGNAPTPARTLVRGLSSLWDADGNVAVRGFGAGVREPTAAELTLAAALPADEGACGDDPWGAIMFRPNLNIAGLESGHTGPGMKTVVPRRAVAKIDARLVSDQDPTTVFAALRAHLEDAGIDAELLASVPPSSTPVDTPLARPVARAVTAAWDAEPVLQPCLGGTTPDFVFTKILGAPSLLVPYAPYDMNHHAPNERITLESLRGGIRCSVAICNEIGAAASSAGARER